MYALILPGKPHVSSLTFQSVINLKTQLERGLLLLDLQLADMSQIFQTLVEQLIETGMLEKEQMNKGTSMFDQSILSVKFSHRYYILLILPIIFTSKIKEYIGRRHSEHFKFLFLPKMGL